MQQRATTFLDHQEEIDQEIRQEWLQVQENITQSTKLPFYIRMKS
jgi:hypothetical protein